jgi:hypothetical protein
MSRQQAFCGNTVGYMLKNIDNQATNGEEKSKPASTSTIICTAFPYAQHLVTVQLLGTLNPRFLSLSGRELSHIFRNYRVPRFRK